jgi:hypothetical protein
MEKEFIGLRIYTQAFSSFINHCNVGEVALLSKTKYKKLEIGRGEANHATQAATIRFVCLLQNETDGPNKYIDPRLQPDF